MEASEGTSSNDEYYDSVDFGRLHSNTSSLSTSSLKKFVYHEKCNLDKDRLADSVHSYNYAASPSKHIPGMSPSPRSNDTLNGSWKFFNFLGVEENEHVHNGPNRKTGEAVVTINAKTSCILVANRTACRLFNYKEEELCGKKVYELFTMEDGIRQEILIERNLDTNGNIVMASGKILEGIDSNGNNFILSVWMKRIKSGDDPRCVVIMEPVDVTKGSFLFDGEGIVKDCDFQFSLLYGYEDPQQMIDVHIQKFIPALVLPVPGTPIEKNVRKQTPTSRTKDNVPFPSTVKIKQYDPEFHDTYIDRTHLSNFQNTKFLYKGFIWVFAHVSGLVTITTNGFIVTSNSNFLRTFLGYTKTELVDRSITCIIPRFYEQIELLYEGSTSLQSGSISIQSVNSGEYTEESYDRVDEILKENSSGSTISELNSSQSASTLEETEISIVSPVAVESLNYKNVSCKNVGQCGSDGLLSCNGYLTSKDAAKNCQQKTKNENMTRHLPVNNEVGSLLSTSSCTWTTSICKHSSVDSELVFENCMYANTPKTRVHMNNDFSDCSNHDLSILGYEGEVSDTSHFEVASENRIDVTDGYVYIKGLETQSPQTRPTKESNCDFVQVSQSVSDVIGECMNEEENKIDNNVLSIEIKQFSDYAIKTSEYTSLGSPLLEIEFKHGDVENIDISTNNPFTSSVVNSPVDAVDSKMDESEAVIPREINSNKDQKKDQKDSRSNGTTGYIKKYSHPKSHKIEHFQISPKKEKTRKNILQGCYYGQAMHKDGSLLPIVFEIKKILLKSKEVFCIWISRDPDEDGEYVSNSDVKSLMNSLNSTMNNSSGNYQDLLHSMKELNVDVPSRGLYNDLFVNLGCIGKGAFGFVNLAERKADKVQVIVKFIRKEKVLKDSWVEDSSGCLIPFEVNFLLQIQHPHIVKVLESYENEDFFQMVMEKHGDGIDLFEFIDKKPQMDEALASYMYRQVLKATEFLHGLNILHRDIKDENIIVDRQFNIKLIDFGSAIYIEKGKLFNTFCGTVEYCSPEVLLGNWYRGPELEMWSLGVTLYTFIFGEHPFFEVEETIQGELFPPFKVSNELMFALCWMLNVDVNSRARLKDLMTYPWFTRPVDIRKYDYNIVLGQHPHNPSQSQILNNEKESADEKSFTDVNVESVECSKYSKCSSSGRSSLSSVNSDMSENSDSSSRKQQKQGKYQPFLADPLDLREDELLSKSF